MTKQNIGSTHRGQEEIGTVREGLVPEKRVTWQGDGQDKKKSE